MSLDDVIGHELASQLTSTQREFVAQAADEAPDGVRIVAAEVRKAGDKIKRPVAVLLSRIDRGQHRDRQADLERADRSDQRVPPSEAFRRLFTAKVEDLRRRGGQWADDNRVVEAGLDYAVGHLDRCAITSYADGESPLSLEADMRRTLNRPRAESGPERREMIRLEWKRIVYSLHDPRISAMFRALKAGCRDPEHPTDAEADACRQALIAELDTLGVQPRDPMAGPPPSREDNLQPIGSALVPPGPPLVVSPAVLEADEEDLPW
jgi:hypothetical protein